MAVRENTLCTVIECTAEFLATPLRAWSNAPGCASRRVTWAGTPKSSSLRVARSASGRAAETACLKADWTKGSKEIPPVLNAMVVEYAHEVNTYVLARQTIEFAKGPK